MDEIKHYWDSIKYLRKFNSEAANNLQMYFVQCCKRQPLIELPKRNFGPSTMCSHCGSFWTKNQPQVRIISGKHPSKLVQKIIKSSSNGNKITKFCETLMKKSLKNKMNKLVMKCSVCSNYTKISCQKPERLQLIKAEEVSDNSMQRKKKKKKKDKTAGLNLSNLSTPKVEERKSIYPPSATTPINLKNKKSKNQETTPNPKTRKLNPNKLNNVFNKSINNKSRNSLSNFLKDLY